MKPALDPGATEEFGPYVVYERLGMGGMAVVHRAKKQGIAGYERKLALKRLLPQLAEDADFVESFIREAKVASLLVHPNIAQIYDFGRIENVYFIAMEHVDGFDVRRLLRFASRADELVPLSVVLSIMIELCDALDYAHTFADEHGNPLGLVHRDVSPSNLIVAHTGHLKVIDFGIAKAESRQLHTSSGRVKGKLGYMSPEAAMGANIGAVSDVFSAGVVAYELLTARPLFSAKTDFETMVRIREAEILPPSHVNPHVPIELDGLILAALSRDPQTRIQSAGEFRSELEAVAALAGVRATAREVADWMLRYAQPEDAWARNRTTPLPDAATASIRLPVAASSHRSLPRQESVLPEPRSEVRAAVPAPMAHTPNPIEAVSLPAPQRSRALLAVLALLVVIAGGLGGYYFLFVRKDPPPAVAAKTAVRFEIQPAGSIISIGGKEVSRSSPFEAELEPGVYSIAVQHDGYKPWTNSVTVRAGERRQTVSFALERGIAHVTVESDPAGLPIELDGKVIEFRTPARIEVASGGHRVQVKNEAGEVWSQEFTASPDGAYTFKAPLVTEVSKKDKPGKRTTQAAAAAATTAATTTPSPAAPTRRPATRVAQSDAPQPKDPEPTVAEAPAPEPEPQPQKPAPQVVTPPKPEPPKSTRVPMVAATTVTKISGEVPSFEVKGNASGDALVKLCINEQGAVTSAKAMKASTDIASALEGALRSWRYKPYLNKDRQPSPACFAVTLRVVVKRAN